MFATHNGPRSTLAVRVLVLLLAAGALFLIGRLTAPADPNERRPMGVPMGYERTPDGARAAALTFASVRARTALLDTPRRRALLEVFATPRFARVADREDRTRDLAPLSGQEDARFKVTGLGSRIDRTDGDAVAVTVWLFQVLASEEVVGSFSTQRVRLVWRDGDWRLDDQRDAAAQAVPDLVQQPQRAATRDLARDLTTPAYGRP